MPNCDLVKRIAEKLNSLLSEVNEAELGNTLEVVDMQIDVERHLANAYEKLAEFLLHLENEEQPRISAHICQCTEVFNPRCPIHTASHFYKPGCCAEPRDVHRHMSEVEYAREFPILFERRVLVGEETYHIELRRFWDGESVCITRLFKGNDEQETAGLCFDMDVKDLAGILPALEELCRSL